MAVADSEILFKMYSTEADKSEFSSEDPSIAEPSSSSTTSDIDDATSRSSVAQCQSVVQRFPVTVMYNAEHGRHVVAKCDMRANDMVMLALPYVWVVHEEFKGKVCSYCISPLTKIRLPCTACREVYYCSRQCKHSDLEIHQHECKILASWDVKAGERYDVAFVRDIKLLLRTLARRTAEKRLRLNKQSMANLNSWDNRHQYKHYMLLQSLHLREVAETSSEQAVPTCETTTTTTTAAAAADSTGSSSSTATADSGQLTQEYELIRDTMARYMQELRHWAGFPWETQHEMVDIVFRNSRNVFAFNNGAHRKAQATYVIHTHAHNSTQLISTH
jgi:hypothetical protein